MSYKTVNTHTETFIIKGRPVKVTADFLKGVLIIDGQTIALQEYINFNGDMEEFLNDR